MHQSVAFRELVGGLDHGLHGEDWPLQTRWDQLVLQKLVPRLHQSAAFPELVGGLGHGLRDQGWLVASLLRRAKVAPCLIQNRLAGIPSSGVAMANGESIVCTKNNTPPDVDDG